MLSPECVACKFSGERRKSRVKKFNGNFQTDWTD